MKETEIIQGGREIAAEINAIKRQTAQVCLGAAVEIGRLLTEAKAQVDYGQWGTWLEENVQYSQSTANNLMRLYESYGQQAQLDLFAENPMELFGQLSPSQALALLGLPRAERREFVETHAMEEVSVRDIEEEVRRQREARQQAEQERGEAQAREERTRAELEQTRRELESARKRQEQQARQARQELADAQLALEQERAEMRRQLDAAKAERPQQAEGQLALVDSEAIRELEEQIHQLRQERDAAERKLQVMGCADIQRFSVLFEDMQRQFDRMMELLGSMEAGESTGRLEGALRTVLERMAGRVRGRGEGT